MSDWNLKRWAEISPTQAIYHVLNQIKSPVVGMTVQELAVETGLKLYKVRECLGSLRIRGRVQQAKVQSRSGARWWQINPTGGPMPGSAGPRTPGDYGTPNE